MFLKYFLSLSLFLLVQFQVTARQSTLLPRSTPEAEGVSSEGILTFLDSAAASPHEFHSLMILRHGKVITEGWWNPYQPDLRHTMYSVSKSFTSTAIGFAVSEQRLTVNDPVISFFPEWLPDSASDNLKTLKVKDLLSMSAGQEPDPTFAIVSRDSNWVKAFLSRPVVYQPGTHFLYNTLATYILSAIIQRVTGQTLIDYLRPRLFDPIGITGMDWETDPTGINTGGWGLRIKTEDMARFGQLYLQQGNWQGKQIIPATWIKEATTIKIEQEPDASAGKKDSSDWLQGYCYQFWRSRHDSYRADGAFGQFILVLPKQDAVIVLTAETADMQAEINLVWKYLLPAMHDGILPANKKMSDRVHTRLAALALPPPTGNASSPRAAAISGKTFVIDPNDKKIGAMNFFFEKNRCGVVIQTGTARDSLSFAAGQWQLGETTRLGPSLLMAAKGHFAGLPASQIAGSYGWKKENVLELTLRYIDSPHTETITCEWEEDKITVSSQNSFENRTVVWKGHLSK